MSDNVIDEVFAARCKYAEWRVVDDHDDKDFVCTRFTSTGYHVCFCDNHCKEYEPVKIKEEGQI